MASSETAPPYPLAHAHGGEGWGEGAAATLVSSPGHPRRLAAAASRAARRLRTIGIGPHLLGLALRTRFQHAGVIVVKGGLPLPQVDNYGGRIEVGSCAFFTGVRLECWKGATILIGTGTYLNRNTEVVAAQNVTIGRDCKIARDVIIMDTDQHALPDGGLFAKPVAIGDRVWIGARAIILKGVSIGDDAVIGAGSVVTRDVPEATFAAGNPCRVIRSIA